VFTAALLRRLDSGLLVCALGLAAAPASSAPITMAFTGTVTNIHYPGVPGTAAGDPFSAEVTYEPLTSDGDKSDPNHGDYRNAVSRAVFHFGPHELAILSPPANQGGITVRNNFAGLIDEYSIELNGSLDGTPDALLDGAPLDGFRVTVDLDDNTGMAFSNDSLPVPIPDLTKFRSASWFISTNGTTGPDFALEGPVTLVAVVPESSTASLLALGLVLRMITNERWRIRGRSTDR